MEHYDPLLAPDPAEWLIAEEGERIALVVENQIAMGDALPVRRVLDRLQSEGLDRHEAIHAIGSVLAGHMSDLLNTGARKGDANEAYWTELGRSPWFPPMFLIEAKTMWSKRRFSAFRRASVGKVEVGHGCTTTGVVARGNAMLVAGVSITLLVGTERIPGYDGSALYTNQGPETCRQKTIQDETAEPQTHGTNSI